MSNTSANIGIRRYFGGDVNEWRNFEPKGGQLYKVVRARGLEYMGVEYQPGDTIPYDGDACYSDDRLMERYFNSGLIEPAT